MLTPTKRLKNTPENLPMTPLERFRRLAAKAIMVVSTLMGVSLWNMTRHGSMMSGKTMTLAMLPLKHSVMKSLMPHSILILRAYKRLIT